MKSESAISKEIRDALTSLGIETFRMNSGAARVRGGFVHGHKKGTADILACLWLPNESLPRWAWIEVKKPGGKQSPEQREFECDRAYKHQIYWLVDSVDDLLAKLKASGARG